MVTGVELCMTRSPALIVLHEGGVWYTNQAGGHLCAQPGARGFYLPLDGRVWGFDEEAKVKALINHWGPVRDLPDWDFAALDLPGLVMATPQEIFNHSLMLDAFEFGEAWLPVVVRDPHEARHILPVADPEQLRDRVCILTWENSD
jgi:hypothetical protein